MLRPYQQEDNNNLRIELRTNKSVLLQSPTGTGKTVLFASIISAASKNNFRTWTIVPRKELLTQSSQHFLKWDIAHNFISAGRNESRAYKTHIVSKDTLIRRWNKIKNWPDLIIIDEAHINYKFQMELKKQIPGHTKIIGFSATPERLDGLGLSDIYDTLITGHSIPWFTERGYLSELKYFAPPIEGLENLHRTGTDFDANELDEVLKKNKVYGKAIEHYEKWGTIKKQTISTPNAMTYSNNNYNRGKPALFFLRTVKAAYAMAEAFQVKGYKFFCIEGKMKTSERKRLISGLTTGEIDGLTSCEILTYGFDCPRVEYGASLRPTMSRALYFQMVGRILRPYENKETGYKKEEALFFDHVNLISEHYDIDNPGIPLFKLENIDWNFSGKQKRKRLKKPEVMRQCPYLDYLYCHKQTCNGCSSLPQNALNFQKEQEQKIIDIQLEESKKPVKLMDRPFEERREYFDSINEQIGLYVVGLAESKILPGPIDELLKIAKRLGRSSMWVYYTLNEKSCTLEEKQNKRKAINIPLLHGIAKALDFKPGWVWYKKKELEKRMVG